MEQTDILNGSPIDTDQNTYSNPNNRHSIRDEFAYVVTDYFQSLKQRRIWMYMAYADIRRRYQRTLIGPFWATLSLGIFILSMGFLFSHLWKTDMKNFLPYFSSGFIAWTFLSSLITDSCNTFISYESLLKQINLPKASFAYLVVTRNFIIFLHQLVIFIIVALIFHVNVNLNTLLIFPAIILLCLTGSWVAIAIGLLCSRFRDMAQVISSLLQISMFVTPIFWPVKQLGNGFKAYLIVNANPLYHYVALIREPFLGKQPHLISWLVVIFLTVFGWLASMLVLAKQHRKLIFWL